MGIDKVFHPQNNDKGMPVQLHAPHTPTPLETWQQPTALSCVVPQGAMPHEINGVGVSRWSDVPTSTPAWEAYAAMSNFAEPEFKGPAGIALAAGAVIREPDGRIWIVAPSNGFAGYKATFPKGRLEDKSAQAAALCEVYEEAGLKVRLFRHLIDVRRTQSFTRYYLAERIGGNPAYMGWESQAVMLVPPDMVRKVATNKYDLAILDAMDSLAEANLLAPPIKPSLAQQEVVDKMVRDFATAVLAIKTAFDLGEPGADKPLVAIEALAVKMGDIILGRDPNFDVPSWNKPEQLGIRLMMLLPNHAKHYGDSGVGLFMWLANQTLKGSQALKDGESEEAVQEKIAAVFEDVAARILGTR